MLGEIEIYAVNNKGENWYLSVNIVFTLLHSGFKNESWMVKRVIRIFNVVIISLHITVKYKARFFLDLDFFLRIDYYI